MTFLAKIVDFKSQHKNIQPYHSSILRAAVQKVKRMFLNDEKMFHLDPPVTDGTSCRFWSVGKKKNVTSRRLIRQRSKFSRSVMVSAGICFMEKGRLHFVPEKVKVNSNYYTEQRLPRLIDDCRQLMHETFCFSRMVHTASHFKAGAGLAGASLS